MPAERHLWQALRGGALGVTCRRQHTVSHYILDFACVTLKLAVEVDGADHGTRRDAVRDEDLRQSGWCVLRYWNNDVLINRDGVVQGIQRGIAELRDRRP
jgi:very-short-patch-repair endonuclease